MEKKATKVKPVVPKAKPAEQEVYTAKGASDVKIHYGGDRERELHVRLIGQARPEFTFIGAWAGKDVRTVLNNLYRAYHLHTRQLRRENQAINLKKED